METFLDVTTSTNFVSGGTESTLESNSGVGVNGNAHTNISSNDGGDGSNEVGNGSVWEVSWCIFVSHLEEVNSATEDDCEQE